jgi:hypothetical protein
MWCAWTQWLLSRSVDTGKPIPRWAQGHLARCETCRDFLSLNQSLEELAGLPEKLPADEGLNLRILGSLDAPIGSIQGRPVPRQVRWKAVWASAAFLFVLVSGIVLLRGPFGNQPFALSGFKNVDISPIKNMIGEVESPYLKEMDYLREGLESVGDKIQAFFNTRIKE